MARARSPNSIEAEEMYKNGMKLVDIAKKLDVPASTVRRWKSRQTVSSWENEKSMPDLQLIITICNTYNFSLDSLLNEDHKFVSKIDMTQKIFRTLKRILPIFCIIGCVYVAVLGIWKINAVRKEEGFVSNVKSLGFELENGLYVLYDEDIIYELPNQKLPFMKFGFNLQQITSTYRNEKFSCNILLNYDEQQYTFNIDYGLDHQITGTIATNKTIEYNDLSKDDDTVLNTYKDTIETILCKMVTYYDAAYL